MAISRPIFTLYPLSSKRRPFRSLTTDSVLENVRLRCLCLGTRPATVQVAGNVFWLLETAFMSTFFFATIAPISKVKPSRNPGCTRAHGGPTLWTSPVEAMAPAATSTPVIPSQTFMGQPSKTCNKGSLSTTAPPRQSDTRRKVVVEQRLQVRLAKHIYSMT